MDDKNNLLIQEINVILGDTTISEIKAKRHGNLKFVMYVNDTLMNTDVTELELTVRSYNCLKRAGYGSIGQLVDSIDGMEQLKSIRNLGKKSAEEIMMKLFLYQFSVLKAEKKQGYVSRFSELNSGI